MLTGVVLARNEEANIVECLSALRPHVEELIVIDMESQDRTIELARPLVQKILSHPLVPEFDAARNLAISESTYEWLWYVDADERISPRTGEVVRQLVRDHGNQFEALVIPFKSYFCGQWMQHCGWWPGYTMPRVLKRGMFEFVSRLHGGVEVRGRQVRLPPDPELGIDHYSYRSVEHYLEKLNRYTSTEAQRLAAQGTQWDWRAAMRETIRDLWMYYEYNPGKLDRERGWILSWLSGQYRWLSQAKLIDLPLHDPNIPPPDGGTAPESLDAVLEFWQSELSALRKYNPQLPLGIVWRSPVFDPSGYADEARAFIKGLAVGSRPLRVDEIRWSDRPCELEHSDTALFTALTRTVRPTHFATITDCIPTLVEPDPHAALNILRTTFETDRLPPSWPAQLVKFDEIWVPSHQNYRAFRRSGVPPEKLRVVRSCYDADLYRPDGPSLRLPEPLQQRFIFLSVFDWQLRKGWDLLLRVYCQEFSADEPVALLLKISRAHGHTLPLIRAQADQVLVEFGQSLIHRPDIVLWDATFSMREMAALYRSASAFVLPSRGEGWGRPYMEAMACGLPTIGTRHLGSDDFLTDENAYRIDASLVPVPEAAASEIPPYRGHRWYEPDLVGLRQAMRHLFADKAGRMAVATRAVETLPVQFGLDAGRRAIEDSLQQAERKFQSLALSAPTNEQTRVVLEGEFFALHSFANINEQLAIHLSKDPRLAISLDRVQHQPVYDQAIPHAWQLRPYFSRPLDGGQHVTIRHAFPPNWNPVPQGRWVHIQPWEFGYLPADWIDPLRHRVDEAWVPSQYVKRVFERSGIPPAKVHVIPWGVDPDEFAPDVEPLLLPTEKSFRFLFVGGLISRKGFDLVLSAYTAEFGPEDDVCLVVKDLGSQTFYRVGNFREELLAAKSNSVMPEIAYLEEPLTTGQLASLYTACQCLAAPYRAEGFGLPILEAMACGLAPIVTSGGAAADFTSPETAYLVPGREVETTHDWQLCGPPLELLVKVEDVRRAMRLAYEDRARTARLGRAAAEYARTNFTWQQTAQAMADRLVTLGHDEPKNERCQAADPNATIQTANGRPILAACMVAQGAERQLPFALAQVTPFVDETVVVVAGTPDRSEAIAREYGAKVIALPSGDEASVREAALATASAHWLFWIDPADRLSEEETERLRDLARSAPDQILELVVDLPKSRLAASPFRPEGKGRLWRHRLNGHSNGTQQPAAAEG